MTTEHASLPSPATSAPPGEHRAEAARYVVLWVVLVLLLVVSLGFGWIGSPVLSAVLVYAVAAVKAWIVLRWYMHLRSEPAFVVWIMTAGFAAVVFLVAGTYADVVHPFGGTP